MKTLMLTLAFLGLMLPFACTNYPTYNNYGRYKSTPTVGPTLEPTPAFIGTFAAAAPNGVAAANGLVYVAQGDGASVSQVEVFDATTSTLNWTWTGSGGSAFKYPNGIAVNAAGTTVYVLDAGVQPNTGVVYAMAPGATPTAITSWATYNGTNLSFPGGIALDSSGNVYVADTDNGRVEEFGPGGAAIASWNGDGTVAPMAVAVDSLNNVYVADGNNDTLWVLAPSGSNFTVTTHWTLPYTYSYSWDYYGLAVDASQKVYVADYYNSQVEVYSGTGTMLGLFDGQEPGATPLVGPDGIALYNGNIYVADYDSYSPSTSAGIIEIFGPNLY